MSPFTRLRHHAWTALVLASGFVATACTPVTHSSAVKPSGQAALPATQAQTVAVGAPTQAPEEVAQERWPWPFDDEDDVLRELEDEFEEGSWTFWPS